MQLFIYLLLKFFYFVPFGNSLNLPCSYEGKFRTCFLLLQSCYQSFNFKIWRLIIIFLSVLLITTHLLQPPLLLNYDKCIYHHCNYYNKNCDLYNENWQYIISELWKPLLYSKIPSKVQNVSWKSPVKTACLKGDYLIINMLNNKKIEIMLLFCVDETMSHHCDEEVLESLAKATSDTGAFWLFLTDKRTSQLGSIF